MTEKLMFVGSVGPLYFDDAEKSYEDSDMLPDDVVSPLQKAVWSDGAIEVVGGAGGTLSADYTGALDKMVAALADTPTANGVSFMTDKFTISPPGEEVIAPTPVFVVTTRDGNAAIGIDGDLIVTGSILGDRISAVSEITLNTGGELKVGADDVVLNSYISGGGGRIQVWDRTTGGNNRSVFFRGALSHYNDVMGDTICQVPPRQMAMGYAQHNDTVEINGEYPMVPTVNCFPQNFRSPYTGTGAKTLAHPGPVTLTGLDAGRYQFKMYSVTVDQPVVGPYVTIQPNLARVYVTYTYPSMPSTLWWPSAGSSDCYRVTTIAGGISRVFVQVMYRCKTNSRYGIKGNFQLQVGSLSGSFIVSDTYDNAYESYADQDWRSVWLMVIPASTGKQYIKLKFTPIDFIPSRYEGVGSRIEYYPAQVITYADGWGGSYVPGGGTYIAYM